MNTLTKQVIWKSEAIPATSAMGSLELMIGEVGSVQPRVLITAGIHGDEGPWGAWAINKLMNRIDISELKGSIRIVPVTNPLAMQADTRNAPVDQLDLNRAFPGNISGSYTEQVAHILATTALENVDYAIDLHGGGSWCVNSFVFEMEGGEALAGAFPAPFVVRAPDRNVTLTGYARSQGVTVVAVEMGGRSQFEEQWADRIAEGLYRALAIAGVIEPKEAIKPLESKALRVSPSTVLRPTIGGIFVPEVGADKVGTIVAKDTVLGRMVHPATQAAIEEFRAPFDRTAIMLLRPFLAQIEGGAMTYVVAEVLDN